MKRCPVLSTLLTSLVAAAGIGADPLENRPASDDVFYMYMPIAWRDSDNDPQRFGDFGGMIDALPYLSDLGVTAIWMNPIFDSPAYHGYQHKAADTINPRFGTEADFLDFVAAAHAAGIKVFIDFVVYGVSHDSPWFDDAFDNPGSMYDNYLAFTNGANTQYLGSLYNTWNGDSVGFIHWNLNTPAVTSLVTSWAEHWIDPNDDGNFLDGVDGYRLDHVWDFDPTESAWGYDLAWWIDWHDQLRSINPDLFTFAEQADWGSHGSELLPPFDAAMTKPFEFAARSALQNSSAAGLYSQMTSTLNSLPAGSLYLATIGDHDVDRITSVIGGSMSKAKAAAAVLMLQPFPPVMYYGDEIGMLGVKQSYGSDANDIPFREPFKWNAVAGPPMSNYWVLNAQAYNNAFSQNNDGRSVQEQEGVPSSLLETYRTLINVRKTHSALRYGSYHAVSNSSSAVWAFLRHEESTETLLVAINLASSFQNAVLDLSDVAIDGGSTTVQDVITGQFLANLTDANKSAYGLPLDNFRFQILAINASPFVPEPTPGALDGLNIPDDFGAQRLVALQDNPTSFGNNSAEANALYLRPRPAGLEIGIPGNLPGNGTGFVILVDSVAGQGQSILRTDNFPTPPSAIPNLDGVQMDAGFAPDVLLFVNTSGSTLYVDRYTLPTTGNGQKRYIGNSPVGGGDPTLAGGSNPNGMTLTLDNSNTAGVSGVSGSGAASATNGLEGLLPDADIVLAEGVDSIKVLVMIVASNGTVSNQLLPGLGGDTPSSLGLVPDLSAIDGTQFTEVSLLVPGDYDGDRDFDLADFAEFGNCLTGPAPVPPIVSGCEVFDFQTDNDVDLQDFAEAQLMIPNG